MKKRMNMTGAEVRGVVAFGIVLALVLGGVAFYDRWEARRMAASAPIEIIEVKPQEPADTTAVKTPKSKKSKTKKGKKETNPPEYREDRLSEKVES